MKFLQSIWMTILLGVVVFVGSLFLMWRQIPTPTPASAAAEAEGARDKSFVFTSNPESELLIKELQSGKIELDEREKRLGDWEARLRSEKEELAAMRRTVEGMLTQVTNKVVSVGAIEADNLKRLAKMYATMTPENAASILTKHEDAGIAKALTFMKEEEGARILEALATSAEGGSARVADITEILRMTDRQPAAGKSP